MKVSELEGEKLDYWVARTEGKKPVSYIGFTGWYHENANVTSTLLDYSTDWGLAGPIIEKEKIWLSDDDDIFIASCKPHVNDSVCFGPTPLIAAMRAYVASKFGEIVK